MGISGRVIFALLGCALLGVTAAAQPPPVPHAAQPPPVSPAAQTPPVSPAAPALQPAQSGAAAGAAGNTGQQTVSSCDALAKAALADPTAIVKQVAGTPSLSFTAPPIIASDQPISLTLSGTADPAARFLAVVQITQFFEPDIAVLLQVIGRRAAEGQSPATLINLQAVTGDKLGVLSFPRYRLRLVECTSNGAVPTTQWGQTTGGISVHLFAIVTALAFVFLVYIAGASAVSSGKGLARLNPIRLAVDGSGRASIANMQIIFFSLIVLFLVTYILLRTGILANLSSDVLVLLGIAWLGSVGGAAVDTNRRRLSFDNWAWAKRKGWVGPSGFHVENPSWSDLISTDDDFDPYKFQMLGFSFVVGISLLLTGVNGLVSFSIPPALQGVLGLSQVTYIGGKMITQGTFGDLDDKLSALRQAEADFIAATTSAWLSPPPAAGSLPAAAVAKPAEYLKFKTLVGPAWTMFQELFPSRGPLPQFEPSL